MEKINTCPNHPFSIASLTCSICENKFCENCLNEERALIFAPIKRIQKGKVKL